MVKCFDCLINILISPSVHILEKLDQATYSTFQTHPNPASFLLNKFIFKMRKENASRCFMLDQLAYALFARMGVSCIDKLLNLVRQACLPPSPDNTSLGRLCWDKTEWLGKAEGQGRGYLQGGSASRCTLSQKTPNLCL